MTASLSLPIGVTVIPDWIAEWFTALDPRPLRDIAADPRSVAIPGISRRPASTP